MTISTAALEAPTDNTSRTAEIFVVNEVAVKSLPPILVEPKTYLPDPGQPLGSSSEASFRLEISAARLLAAWAAAVCATGPIIWVVVRYWLFAP